MERLRKATGSLWPAKPKWPLVRSLPGCGFVGHELGDLAQVAVEDERAVQLDLDLRAVDGDFLEVPFADGALIAARGGDHAVGRAVGLARVNLLAGGLFVVVVEDLDFAHADVGGVAVAGIADGQAVVAARRQLEFEPGDEVGVFVLGVNRAAFAAAGRRWRRPRPRSGRAGRPSR